MKAAILLLPCLLLAGVGVVSSADPPSCIKLNEYKQALDKAPTEEKPLANCRLVQINMNCTQGLLDGAATEDNRKLYRSSLDLFRKTYKDSNCDAILNPPNMITSAPNNHAPPRSLFFLLLPFVLLFIPAF